MVIKLLNTSEYLELCEAIGDEILLLPICQTYKKLQQEIKNNSEIIDLINKFEIAKEAYADVERYGGKYHPDYKIVSQQLIEAKSNLFQNSYIKEFKECEREIQLILDNIAKSLSQAVEFKMNKSKSCGCGSGNCSK
jgi:cell fate (sporulation/competence/biofilm development) regulator YlbF (YheA/YmcA/DUF963 family)